MNVWFAIQDELVSGGPLAAVYPLEKAGFPKRTCKPREARLLNIGLSIRVEVMVEDGLPAEYPLEKAGLL